MPVTSTFDPSSLKNGTRFDVVKESDHAAGRAVTSRYSEVSVIRDDGSKTMFDPIALANAPTGGARVITRNSAGVVVSVDETDAVAELPATNDTFVTDMPADVEVRSEPPPQKGRGRKKAQPQPPPQTVHVIQPPPQPVRQSPSTLAISRVPVVFRSPLFGRMKFTADTVAVSDTILMIGFMGSDVEIELPVSTLENPLSVAVDTHEYQCLCGQWSATLPLVQGGSLRLLVFVRLPDSANLPKEE